jgi:hypothetical protein
MLTDPKPGLIPLQLACCYSATFLLEHFASSLLLPYLTDILGFSYLLANDCFLVTCIIAWSPPKDRVGPAGDMALASMLNLQKPSMI